MRQHKVTLLDLLTKKANKKGLNFYQPLTLALRSPS